MENDLKPMSSARDYKEKLHKPLSGFIGLAIIIVVMVCGIGTCATGAVLAGVIPVFPVIMVLGFILFVIGIFLISGLSVVSPNDAVVYLLFGKYLYTVAEEGFFLVNPFARKQRLSLKAITLNNEKQKVNDERGNPIEIGVVVIWRITDTVKALFNVDNYYQFITTQCDSAIRNVARLYPYDVEEGKEEKSLRGSSSEISEQLMNDLQSRVDMAGIEILDARISHLAYAPEIAAAMLQRQQAEAIVQARQKIVDGAVGMVDMALKKLGEGNVVELDEERKAQMVSNLLVVLCGNKDAQPVVNSTM